MEGIAVLCLTSNAYVHCLPAFAYCWRKHWPGQPVTVAHYDAMPPIEGSEDWEKFYLGQQADLTWSQGLVVALDMLDAPRVLLVLEDYWLCDTVNVAAIGCASHDMADNPGIGKIDLSGDRLDFPHYYGPPHFPYVYAETEARWYKEDGGFRNKLFLMSYQAAIWDTAFLLEHLRPDEDAWQSEANGTKRLLGTSSLILGCKKPPLQYVQALKGGKPRLLRTERFPADFLAELKKAGVLAPWEISA